MIVLCGEALCLVPGKFNMEFVILLGLCGTSHLSTAQDESKLSENSLLKVFFPFTGLKMSV